MKPDPESGRISHVEDAKTDWPARRWLSQMSSVTHQIKKDGTSDCAVVTSNTHTF